MPHSCFLWFLTSSTSYSSSSSLIISSGGAGSMCCHLKCGTLHCVSRSLLNMLWIAYSSGNSSWNASWPISFEILKGLYLFWSNFFKSQFNWIFLASNHMLSPTFSSCGSCLFLSNCFFIALSDWFILFVHCFESDMLLITFSLCPMYLFGLL